MTIPNETSTETPKRIFQRAGGHRLTRRRVPLSCTACRVRKLKCNREKPCQNCIVRGETNAASCTYAEKVEKKHSGQSNPRSDAEDMRKRLNRLENSILSMMSGDTNKKEGSDSTDSHVTISANPAPDLAGGQRISYDTRSTHWDAILNELGAMKDAWSEENDKIELSSGPQQSTATREHRPGLLTGLTQPPDRSTILASLPSREAADKLLIRFFESYNPAIPARYVLHKSTFLLQYSHHWTDPSKTKIMWIGLLYSIFFLAMQSYLSTDEVPPEFKENARTLAELYRVRTAECLTVADLTRPTEFMIETLDLHSFAEYVQERDGDMGTWIISGMMMRLALQQGYHRDPSQIPGISVFQAEMRRRIWSAVNQHELLFSVQIGLPKAIRYSESDTEPPRNLYEEELYEDMTELPPSRPWTTDTEVCYQVVKYHLMRCYGRVVEFVHILEPQPFEEVLKLDMALMECREMIPPHLQFGTLEEMKNDPPSRIMEKFILQAFWHKAVCILHRKFWDALPADTREGTWFYSRKTSVASALAMLDQQYTMHRATDPGGLMNKMKWYHFSITNHDFLLAAMIICLDLMSIQRTGSGPNVPMCIIPAADKMNSLRRSRAIWLEIVDDCRDAKTAVRILTAVLKKLSVKMKEDAAAPVLPRLAAPNAIASLPPVDQLDSLRYNQYFTDCVGLGMPPSEESSSNSDTMMQDNFLDSFSTDLTIPADFNWDGWDQFLAGQTQQSNQDLLGEFDAQTGNMNGFSNGFLTNVDTRWPFAAYIGKEPNAL